MNKTLDEVAKEDPKYLQWMYKETSENMKEDAFDALEKVMFNEGIDFP